jgi:phosphoribosyl 1,2-cyclic phosphodiesterase
MKIKIHGSRGSFPASPREGFDVTKYGGATTCIEVQDRDGNRHIVDSGTGIIPLGYELMKGEFGKGKGKLNIYQTHTHWDHIQGFPFFVPIYVPGNNIKVYGHKNYESKLVDAIAGQGIPRPQVAMQKQMSEDVFPVTLDQLASDLEFYSLEGDNVYQNGLTVTCEALNHPKGVLSYKFKENGKTFVVATDVEIVGDVKKRETMSLLDMKLLEWMKGADIVMIDSQYLPEEMEKKKGWGHSSYDRCIDYAIEAGVPEIILTHHEPANSDEKLDELEHRAQEYLRFRLEEKSRPQSALKMTMARDGMEIELDIKARSYNCKRGE